MKRLFWTGVTVIAICAWLLPQYAQGASPQKRLGRVVFPVLKIDQGARSAGMGGAYVSVANDINSIFVNSAGLAYIENGEYTVSYTRWLVDSQFYSGAVAYNIGNGVLGVSVLAFTPEKVEETTIFQPQGTERMLSLGDLSIGLAYAKKMTDRLTFGVQFRWTQETLDLDRLSAYDVSMGTFFDTGFRSLRLAMAIKNLGSKQKIFELNYHMPTTFTFGFAMEVFGVKGEPAYLTVTGENFLAPDYASPQYRLGGELWFQDTLALRGGRKINFDAETYSLGVGIKFRPVEGKEMRADFAYTSFGNTFNAPLRFSLSGSF